MKVTVNRGDDTQEIEYPCLMTNDRGSVAIFVDENEAFLLKSSCGNSVGYYSELSQSSYKKVEGTVTLEND